MKKVTNMIAVMSMSIGAAKKVYKPGMTRPQFIAAFTRQAHKDVPKEIVSIMAGRNFHHLRYVVPAEKAKARAAKKKASKK